MFRANTLLLIILWILSRVNVYVYTKDDRVSSKTRSEDRKLWFDWVEFCGWCEAVSSEGGGRFMFQSVCRVFRTNLKRIYFEFSWITALKTRRPADPTSTRSRFREKSWQGWKTVQQVQHPELSSILTETMLHTEIIRWNALAVFSSDKSNRS